MEWIVTINRGSTFRMPVTITDEAGAPTSFLDTTFTITPETGATILLTPGNGKLKITPFVWRERWWKGTPYNINDVVLYKTKLWLAIQPNLNRVPITGAYWKLFSTFEFLITDDETSTYLWSKGTYKWKVVRSNGDVDGNYLNGAVEVHA